MFNKEKVEGATFEPLPDENQNGSYIGQLKRMHNEVLENAEKQIEQIKHSFTKSKDILHILNNLDYVKVNVEWLLNEIGRLKDKVKDKESTGARQNALALLEDFENDIFSHLSKYIKSGELDKDKEFSRKK